LLASAHRCTAKMPVAKKRPGDGWRDRAEGQSSKGARLESESAATKASAGAPKWLRVWLEKEGAGSVSAAAAEWAPRKLVTRVRWLVQRLE
jgi:hypothetical protein